VLLPFLVALLPEVPVDLAGDEDVEDHHQAEKPPEVPEPDHPCRIEQSPKGELCPFVTGEFLQAHVLTLFLNRLDDRFERLRIVHREVGEDLAVQADVLGVQLTHELGVGQTVLTRGSVDTLDPEGAEVALLGLAVTVSIGQTFLVGVLGYGPNILPGEEVTAGSLKNLLAACAGCDRIN